MRKTIGDYSRQLFTLRNEAMADGLVLEGRVSIPAAPDPLPWTTLGELRPGALFQTLAGFRFLKSTAGCCYAEKHGEPAWFDAAVEVRELPWPGEEGGD